MNSPSVFIVVEGKTEAFFIRDLLAPELSQRGLLLTPIPIGKLGHRYGNVTFQRAQTDIIHLLKQHKNSLISTMMDCYGIDSEWPGKKELKKDLSAIQKADHLEDQFKTALSKVFPDFLHAITTRFIPYFSMQEFEALLFSEPVILANSISQNAESITTIVDQFETPEEINDHPQTAPSKRIEGLYPGYQKTIMGITICKDIGIKAIRRKCPNFHRWVCRLEEEAQKLHM